MFHTEISPLADFATVSLPVLPSEPGAPFGHKGISGGDSPAKAAAGASHKTNSASEKFTSFLIILLRNFQFDEGVSPAQPYIFLLSALSAAKTLPPLSQPGVDPSEFVHPSIWAHPWFQFGCGGAA